MSTGTHVAPREKWHLPDPDVLSWIFKREFEDICWRACPELRKIVEPEAAALAAKRRINAQLAMGQALKAMAEHTLISENGRLADQSLHAALLDASGNPFLASLTSSFSVAVTWTTLLKQRRRPLQRARFPDYRRACHVIRDAVAKAASEAMADLIDVALIDTAPGTRPRAHKQQRGRILRADCPTGASQATAAAISIRSGLRRACTARPPGIGV